MNLKKFSLIAFTALTVFTTISCDNSDDSGDIIDPNEVIAPTAYSFERGTESTVSFSGQTTRINMGNEIGDALKDPTLTLASINAMYNHQVDENDFSDADLNASDKNLISKTAASRDYFFTNSVDAAAIKADFTSFITGQVNEVFPAWNNLASSGVAGQLQEAGGGSTRYINSKGLEYNQAFIKGTIGAVMLDQINNHYLGESILDEASNRDDNDADILATDKNYTNMEHKWDEAFGYLYGAEADIENPSN